MVGPSEEKRSVEVALSATDILSFERWARQRLTGRLERLLAALGFVGFVALVAAAAALSLVFAAAATALFVGCFLGARQLESSRLAQARIRQAALYSGTLTLDSAGVRFGSPGRSQSLRWDDFLEVAETEHHVYLMTCINCAITVPKRCFASKSECRGFVDFAQARVGASSGTPSSAH